MDDDDYSNIAIRFPKTLVNRMDEYLKITGNTRSPLIRDLIHEHLKDNGY